MQTYSVSLYLVVDEVCIAYMIVDMYKECLE
jgi:hypothetical protein